MNTPDEDGLIHGPSGVAGGAGRLRELLGGKGAGLVEMRRMGLPVPPAFTITTEACRSYLETGELTRGLMDGVAGRLRDLERETGKSLGGAEDPLLVSVRSGAAVSMPGMMDTILNLGLGEAAAEGLARRTGDPRFTHDSHRRFVQMFASVVLGVPEALFERALDALKEERGAREDTDLDAGALRGLVATYEGIVAEHAGRTFPEDPREQLELAIRAVFDSWLGDRARAYRREFGIPASLGTAVTVQAMVFGNMGGDSATGVAFTRNPATGERGPFGEFLVNAQGEDVVAGARTPLPLAGMRDALPRAFEELSAALGLLEREYGDMQDVEFTVERDHLYVLQTRDGKRTAAAALKIARDMADEGLISREEALLRVDPEGLEQLLHPRLDPGAEFEVVARGLGASPGAATGKIVLTAEEAAERGGAGEAIVLVRRETSPDDVAGMMRARGVLTALGGMTSHAAVVARGMGKPAVTGCASLRVDEKRGEVRIAGRTFRAGETITIDGARGEVVAGEVPLVEPEANTDLEEVLRWADGVRSLGVRANADTPADAARARELGAGGIGLCRTEHMFMEEGRLALMRAVILAEGAEETEAALAELRPLQRRDFEGILAEMDGLPVTIRLLDPPLHEFLPDPGELADELDDLERADGASANRASTDGTSQKAAYLRRRLGVVRGLQEENPMLGLRGVRLGTVRPEIYRMQVGAVAEAVKTAREGGGEPMAEIMVPLVGFPRELAEARKQAETVLSEILGPDHGVPIGTMIELPRACLVADEIAARADFFSFGTNDLTQTTLGFSRDDAEGAFLAEYLERGVLRENPFEMLDRRGVGRLVSTACDLGRGANARLKLGICGEHGGDPGSIAFCHAAGLDYVSCSPYRVPVARLAAAQAALRAAPEEAEGEPARGRTAHPRRP